MALPTTNLTLHVDASDTDKLFTTYNISGTHTGTPADGNNVQAWDDETDGIADVCLAYVGDNGPTFQTSTPLMLDSCLRFVNTGSGQNHSFKVYDQTGVTAKDLSDLISASAWTVYVSFYVDGTPSASANIYDNSPILTDNGGYFGIHLKDMGGSTYNCYAYNYDGAVKSVAKAISLNTSYVFMMRLESGNLYAALDGGAETSAASGNTQVLTNDVQIGRVQGNGAFNLQCRIGEMAIYNAALTGSNLSDATSYFTAKWLGAGGGGAVPILMQHYHGG